MQHLATQPTPAHTTGIITIISSCHGLSHFYQLVTPALFVFISPALDVTYSQLATVVLVFSIASSFGQPLSGIYVDRLGGLTTLTIGTCIYSTGILLYSVSHNWLMLLTAAVVSGLGNSIYHPSDLSIINHKIAYRHLPVAYSWHVIGGQIGWALAPVCMTALALAFDWRVALMIAAIPGFAMTIVLFLYRDQLSYPIEKVNSAHHTSQTHKTFIQMLAIPWIWLMMFFFAMHSMATMPIAQFGQVIFDQLYALSPEVIAIYISLFLLISCAGTIVGGYILSKASNQHAITESNNRQFTKANNMTIAAMTIAALGYGIMPAFNADTLIIALAITGFAVGFTSPLRDSLVRIMTGGNNQGKAYGIVYSGLDIGMLSAPLLGLLIDLQLAGYTLYVPAMASAIAVMTVLLSKRSHHNQETAVTY